MVPPLDDATRTEARLLLREATATTSLPQRSAARQVPWAASASDQASAPHPAPMAPPLPPLPPRRRTAVADGINGRLVAVFSVAWVLGFVVQAVQPLPDGPHVAPPAWAVFLNSVYLLALLATIVGFAVRQRWALLASALAASTWAAGVVACPLVNHHETVGVAWGVALATSIGIAAASAVAFARAGRPS